jgi:hypothetical protein
MKNLPSAKDISPTGGLDLDEKLALKNFHGKNVKEASDMVFENAFYYQDNFMCMGKKAFAFYFPIYCDYLKSEKSSQDANTVNAILGIIDIRLNFDASSIKMPLPQNLWVELASERCVAARSS